MTICCSQRSVPVPLRGLVVSEDGQTAALPDRLSSLARWIGQTLNEPASAWWAAGHGTLHETLLDQIEWHLGRPDENVARLARKIWSLLLESFRHSPFDERWFDFERLLNRD